MRKGHRDGSRFQSKVVHLSGIDDWIPRIIRLVEASLKKNDLNRYTQFIKLTPVEKREYVLMNWMDLSIDPDPECVKKMNDILHPLLANTVKRDAVEEIKTHFAPMLASVTKSTIDLQIVMSRGLSDAVDRTDSEASQALLVRYQNLYAGGYCAQVDMLVWVIILSGRQYYRFVNGRNIPKKLDGFAAVQSENDRQKLAFLSNEGLQSVAEASDIDLRNAIAHSDYDISDETGLTYNSTAQGTRVTVNHLGLREKFLRLLMMVSCVNESMMAFYVGWARGATRSLPDEVRRALLMQLPPHLRERILDDSDDK